MPQSREERSFPWFIRLIVLIILSAAVCFLVRPSLNEWADSLPPSQAEIRGEIPMGPVKGK